MRIATIVVATDLSDFSRNAVEHAVALSRATGAELIVVHVREAAPRYKDLYRTEPREPGAPPGYAELHADAFDPNQSPPHNEESAIALSQAHDDQLSRLPRVRRFALAGQPVDGILDAARQTGASLIVVGSQGRGALAGALLGSTAEAVIRRSGIPVLAVPGGIPPNEDAAVIAILDELQFADSVLRRATAVSAALHTELIPLKVPNDGLVDSRPELAGARLIVIAFERDETERVSKSDPNVRVLLRRNIAPVLTVPVN